MIMLQILRGKLKKYENMANFDKQIKNYDNLALQLYYGTLDLCPSTSPSKLIQLQTPPPPSKHITTKFSYFFCLKSFVSTVTLQL